MNPQDLALSFIRYFCAGEVDKLKPLLDDDFKFQGPMYDFDSAEKYLISLHEDPPEPGDFTIISITEGDNSAAVFYEYNKPLQSIKIAQLFKCKDGLIQDVLIIFDTGQLKYL